MIDRAKKYLHDSHSSIYLIEQFTLTTGTFDQYCKDVKTQSAVERQLGIIGEAVNQFNKLETELRLSSASQIVGFRNRLIHSYDNIDNSIIWAMIKRHLPLLQKEISEKLSDG